MKIMYHVALEWNDEQINIMNIHGINPKKGHSAVQIDEETYFKVRENIIKWRGSDGIRYPYFTDDEIKRASFSVKNGWNECGYPMPDMDGGYKEITYDLSNYCSTCGTGLKQKDAFRLKNTPPLGKKKVFGLGWVYDEYFVEKKLYEEIFKPLGINCREVFKYKKDIALEDYVQLVLSETEEKLDLSEYPKEVCSKCGKTKYLAMPIGFYPAHTKIIAPIYKSLEYFGSGALAFKRIFVSKELRELLINQKIDKRNFYVPCR